MKNLASVSPSIKLFWGGCKTTQFALTSYRVLLYKTTKIYAKSFKFQISMTHRTRKCWDSEIDMLPKTIRSKNNSQNTVTSHQIELENLWEKVWKLNLGTVFTITRKNSQNSQIKMAVVTPSIRGVLGGVNIYKYMPCQAIFKLRYGRRPWTAEIAEGFKLGAWPTLQSKGDNVTKEENTRHTYSGKAGRWCTPELAPAHCKTNEIVIASFNFC